MVYQLKTKEYYGNAKQVTMALPSAINSNNLRYLGDAMVLNMATDECANGTTWESCGNLLFVTSDNMSELVDHVKKHEILLVTSCGKF